MDYSTDEGLSSSLVNLVVSFVSFLASLRSYVGQLDSVVLHNNDLSIFDDFEFGDGTTSEELVYADVVFGVPDENGVSSCIPYHSDVNSW